MDTEIVLYTGFHQYRLIFLNVTDGIKRLKFSYVISKTNIP